MNEHSKCWGLWLLVGLAANIACARPFTATDLVSVREIGAVALTPDERRVIWHQSEAELASNRIRTRLWSLDLQHPDNQPQPLSSIEDRNAHHPQVSADGAWIYFLSDSSGREQLWRVAVDGGGVQQVSDFDVAVSGYSLSPGGDQVAIRADTSTACNELPCKFPQPVESCCGSGRSFDDAYVQRGDAWRSRQARSTIYVAYRDEWMMPEVRSRIYVMSVNGGKAVSAMDRWLGDANGEQIAWGDAGKTLFFTLRDAGRNERFSLNLDVIASHIGSPTSENLTNANAGVDTLPVVSPDGRWLAYVSARSTHEPSFRTLQLRDLSTGKVTQVARGWDASVSSIAWEPDSRAMLVTARVGMDEPLFRISLEQGKVTRLTAEGHVANVIPMARGGAIFTLDTMLLPPDLYRVAADGKLERLTAINAYRLADIDMPRLERFDFKAAKGAKVSGWAVTPEVRNQTLPTLLLIHDGLYGEPANSWSSRWNPVLFSAPGYAVLGIDSPGTILAPEDLQTDWSAATRLLPWLDPARTCIAGAGAYGGYLVYRIAGQRSSQPRCMIAHGGVVDATTMSYQTDEPWMHDWQNVGSNPLHQARAWQTPLLILHGEKDFRVPYTQSVAAFTAAQRGNVPSRLVVFPDEGAWVRAPKNTIQWYGEIFNWLDRWLAAVQQPPPS